jgi:(1->4)-alpha-D-glucan 1-alpha-D-glucosylmutase
MPPVKELGQLLARVTERIRDARQWPESTYRLQFHAGFTFRDAVAIVPYLHDLGITHCYASPYLKARPGSTHGYDITNHQLLNPEIGSDEDYATLLQILHDHGMGQILDTVPNHMGVVGNENPWWNDVLENGPSSVYASYFDISWYSSPRPELRGRVLIAVLGDPYGKVLESGELRLVYEAGAFSIHYYEHRFPVDPRTYEAILADGFDTMTNGLSPQDPALVEYQSILTAVRHLPEHSDTAPKRVAERQREKEVIKRRLATLVQDSTAVREHLEQTLARFNGYPQDPRSFDSLDRLLDQQAYRLSYWRVAADEINYRRFFDVNELAALSMEREEVFRATHALILRLLAEGKLAGLRIDHPDGLYDPKQYLQRLQQYYLLAVARILYEANPANQGNSWAELEGPLLEQIAGTMQAQSDDLHRRPLYVVVEKILGANEPLPSDWPMYGTNGYAFLNMINSLYVDSANADAFTKLYRDLIGNHVNYEEVVYQKKYLILHVAMSSELHMLAFQLDRLAQKNRWSRDFTMHTLRRAMREIIASFPVYRSYISDEGVRDTDRRYVDRAVHRAMVRHPTTSRAVYRFVRDMILLKYPETFSEEDRAEQRHFAGKFQQVTAPVTAKGVEDTAFYNFNRLLSLNEVGGDPSRFGLVPETLHRYFQERQAQWTYAMSPLSTHDTKRSEDVRARLNVLSEIPDVWREAVTRWRKLNEVHRKQIDDRTAPDANEEYLIYQTLVGAWPLKSCSDNVCPSFADRIKCYLVKALHEAKVHSSWVDPDAEYDDAVQEFAARLLNEQTGGPFLAEFRPFVQRISHFGLLNSLSQTLLRITAPGIPDTYQGTELWDFSLVDPDNRRPVNYEERRRLLAELRDHLAAKGDRRALARELIESKEDGRVKLYLTWRALTCRRDRPDLFSSGAYLPVEVTGPLRNHVFAFLRRQGNSWALVAVPLLLTRLIPEEGALPLGAGVWRNARLLLPKVDPQLRLENVLTGEVVHPAAEGDGLGLRLADVFAYFTVALYVNV